jgi:hypothetical protein
MFLEDAHQRIERFLPGFFANLGWVRKLIASQVGVAQVVDLGLGSRGL